MIYDMIVDKKVDILCLTETWLAETDGAAIAALLPDTHVFHSCPRKDGRRGGGVGVVASKAIKSMKSIHGKFTTFESIEFRFSHNKENLIFYTIYRPPDSDYVRFSEEFLSFLMRSEAQKGKKYYVGDFNVAVNKTDDPHSLQFLETIESFNLQNHVLESTHQSGNILDLVITKNCSNTVHDLDVEPVNSISDHKLIEFEIGTINIEKPYKTVIFRDKKLLSATQFSQLLHNNVYLPAITSCSHNISATYPMQCTECYAQLFNGETKKYIDSKAPTVRKEIQITNKNNKWYNESVLQKKRELRKAERKMHIHKTEEHIETYRRLRKEKCQIITDAKKIVL